MPRLQYLVEQELAARLSMESVFEMLKWSHELKDDFAWALALDLVRQNYTTFVASPQALQVRACLFVDQFVASWLLSAGSSGVYSGAIRNGW